MRIAFNATSLLSPLTGIGQYSRHLAQGFLQHPEVDADFFYGAFWQKEVRETPMPGAQRLLPWIRNHVPYSYALRRLVQAQRFRAHVKSNKFDLYHEPNILPLPFDDGPTVVTVHDLSWIRYPETHPVERVRAMNKYFERGLKQAALLLTDSKFVKQELIGVFGVDEHAIIPIPLGVEPLFRPCNVDQTRPVLDRFGLAHGHYLLAVGTLEPRKNLGMAITAYTRLPPATRARYPLVLVGMSGWLNSPLEAQIAPLLQAGEVRRLGYLSRSDLACVTAGATSLIYPSLYEGFGLPPLEAMSCGVPVIASDRSSLPEVVADTGLLIPPDDLGAVSNAMQRMIDDPALRQVLSEKSYARSKLFSWPQCVTQTLAAYRHVLGAEPATPQSSFGTTRRHN
jgi:glycosyltransferase involved in cell wall biosynthesis